MDRECHAAMPSTGDPRYRKENTAISEARRRAAVRLRTAPSLWRDAAGRMLKKGTDVESVLARRDG